MSLPKSLADMALWPLGAPFAAPILLSPLLTLLQPWFQENFKFIFASGSLHVFISLPGMILPVLFTSFIPFLANL